MRLLTTKALNLKKGFDLDELKRKTPIQNNGTSAKNIAEVAYELLETEYRKVLTYSEVI